MQHTITRAALPVFVLAAVLLAACGGAVAPAPAAVEVSQAPATEAPAPTSAPTDTAVPATEVPPSPTATETLAPTTAPEPTPTATEAPTAAPVVADASSCVTCHTSEETLQKLAKEEEPAEELSEGEG